MMGEISSTALGSVRIDFPCALAALSGYSDQPMRRICRELGAGYAIGEVLLDTFVLQVRRKRGRFLGVADDEHPVAGQIMGNTAENLVAAACRIVEAGFDVVDLNMGCPVRKVVGRRRGGWLLSDQSVAIGMIRQVRDAVPDSVPVTVKLRRGTDDSSESRDRFFAILDGAMDAGIAGVTVHGRTVEQKYIGPSDWNFLAEVKRYTGNRIVVFGSGDLFTASDVVRMIAETGVDGVTVARGAIGYPWIFRECAALLRGEPLSVPPTLAEQRELLERQFAYAVEVYGEQRATHEMGRFFLKTAMRAHPQSDAVRGAFMAVGVRRWREVLAAWYG